MLKYYKIENGRITKAPDEDSADIVLMGSPSQEQRGALVKKYEIAEHTIASAFDNDELSRVEYDDDFTTIVFKIILNSGWNPSESSSFRTGSCSFPIPKFR